MDSKYVAMLPPEIADIVSQLEALAKSEIAVELAPAHLRRLDARFGHTVHLFRRGKEAKILLHKPEVTTQALVHEVLHLRRAWIDRAWALRPSRQVRLDPRAVAAVEEACKMIDETMEHAFFLIPEEKRLGVFDERIWNGDSSRNLADSHQVTDENARKRVAATEWVQAKHLVTDSDLRKRWAEKLKEWNCWELGESYEMALRKAFPDKRGMLSLTKKHLDVSHRILEIWRYDFHTKKDEVRQL